VKLALTNAVSNPAEQHVSMFWVTSAV